MRKATENQTILPIITIAGAQVNEMILSKFCSVALKYIQALKALPRKSSGSSARLIKTAVRLSVPSA